MGRGKELLIDEWFYYHFADEKKLKKVTTLFINIFEVCDKIILKRGTPIDKKFYELAEISVNYPPLQRSAVKTLIRLFLQNSNKISWIENDIEIDKAVEIDLHKNDLYLVKMCLQSKEKIFVTTDNRLAAPMNKHKNYLGIEVYLAEDFMKLYPNI
jgi:hypothetical protein